MRSETTTLPAPAARLAIGDLRSLRDAFRFLVGHVGPIDDAAEALGALILEAGGLDKIVAEKKAHLSELVTEEARLAELVGRQQAVAAELAATVAAGEKRLAEINFRIEEMRRNLAAGD